MRKVFSKVALKKWLADHWFTSEEIEYYMNTLWVKKSVGKTKKECSNMGIAIDDMWLVDIESEFSIFVSKITGGN